MNIKKFLIRGKDQTKYKPLKNTIWQRVIAGVVYFLLFTFLISSNLFISKLNLQLNQPSPELITAPYNKDIEDIEKYHEDQETAAAAVKPVYTPNEEYISGLASDISKTFLTLNNVINTEQDEATRISQLKKEAPFSALSEKVLIDLTKLSDEELTIFQQTASEIIIGRARDLDTGAVSQKDVSSLRDRMIQDISVSSNSDAGKSLMREFIEEKVKNPTLLIDQQATEKERDAARAVVKLEVHHYQANQKIVGPGEIADEKVFQVLAAYGLVDNQSPWRATGGIALIVLCGMGAMVLYMYRYKKDTLRFTAKMVLVGLTIGLVLIISKGVVALNLGGSDYNSLAGMMIPVAWATMTVAILVDVELALLVSVVLSVFSALLVDPTLSSSYGLHAGLVALFGGIVGVHSVSHLSQRSDLARAGIYVSAVNVLTISGIALASNMRLTVWAVGILLGAVSGIASSVFTVGTLHWFESGFNITSAVRLLELSNPNRPLLKRLLMEAPGTYHHSILVGNLAEAAAEAVNADATLVRVGAMYHDIGKLKRPYFFIENQFAQENPHDKIAPTLSSLIITSHIKDGLEMAKENKLPEPIQDIIAQHHGDSLVTFFYHKAKEENDEVPEEAFDYDTPKPQSKEAALVCLADSVEAAVRSMKQPTPGRIEGLIRKIIKDKLNDEQLDRSDLTFQDLDRIAMAFVRILTGIFHSRVEYPELPNSKNVEKGNTEQASKKEKHDNKDNEETGDRSQ